MSSEDNNNVRQHQQRRRIVPSLGVTRDFTSNVDFIASTRAFALDLEDNGDGQQAAAVYIHLMPIVRSAHGEEDLSCIGIQYDLARFRNQAGKYDEGEALAAALVDLRERIMGLTHQPTLNVREALASM